MKEDAEETTTVQMTIAAAILVILNLCPFLFCSISAMNWKKLNKPEIKSKVGTLYNGLKAEKYYVMSYSVVFLIRRSLFVTITFTLF